MEESCNDIIGENDLGWIDVIMELKKQYVIQSLFLCHCSVLLTSLQVCFLVKADEVCIYRFIFFIHLNVPCSYGSLHFLYTSFS